MFFGNASIGTRGGWVAKAVLRACRKVVKRPNSGKPTDRLSGKVMTVDEFRTSRVRSAMNCPQPCEEELDRSKPTRPEGWKSQPAPQAAKRIKPPKSKAGKAKGSHTASCLRASAQVVEALSMELYGCVKQVVTFGNAGIGTWGDGEAEGLGQLMGKVLIHEFSNTRVSSAVERRDQPRPKEWAPPAGAVYSATAFSKRLGKLMLGHVQQADSHCSAPTQPPQAAKRIKPPKSKAGKAKASTHQG
ncbi:hypothetical protein QJQ45_005359 [Haematococcus lacustris]|nr:hypothetical protein QJQ45_005359 [Haematococcus lacustris]